MKMLVGLSLLLWTGRAMAAPLTPLTGGFLDGVPLAQALGTMRELEVRGGPRLFSVMSKPGGECGVSDVDDADTCPGFTLFAEENGETSVPVDFTLFRLPETLGWSIPKPAQTVRWRNGRETEVLNACELKKTAKGWGWQGTSYSLTITENLAAGHYVFAADLTKLPGARDNCGEYPASNNP